MKLKQQAAASAKRVGRPVIERIRPVLNAGNEERIAAAQANGAALEVLVGELTREVRSLQSRVRELEKASETA